MPAKIVSTAMTTRHRTGSVLVARANAPLTPARRRPWVGRTNPLRQANAVSGGGSAGPGPPVLPGPPGPPGGANGGGGGGAAAGPAAGPGGSGGRTSVMLSMVDRPVPQKPREDTL